MTALCGEKEPTTIAQTRNGPPPLKRADTRTAECLIEVVN